MRKPIVTTIEQPAPPAAAEAFIVARAFNSEHRRFAENAPITRADLKGSRLDFDHLVKVGIVAARPAA